MSINLTPALEQRLQHLAAETHRTPDEVAQEGLDRFLAYEEDLHATVTRGREDIAAGRLIEHDEVFARIENLLRSR
jgi:predicted transcriptional regulator